MLSNIKCPCFIRKLCMYCRHLTMSHGIHAVMFKLDSVVIASVILLSLINSVYTMPLEDTEAIDENWGILNANNHINWQYGSDDAIPFIRSWEKSKQRPSDNTLHLSNFDADVERYSTMARQHDKADGHDDAGDNDDNGDPSYDNLEHEHNRADRTDIVIPIKHLKWNHLTAHRAINNDLQAWKDYLMKQRDEATGWRYSLDYKTDLRLTADLHDHNTLTLPMNLPMKRGM